jgi:hypothetical protein
MSAATYWPSWQMTWQRSDEPRPWALPTAQPKNPLAAYCWAGPSFSKCSFFTIYNFYKKHNTFALQGA